MSIFATLVNLFLQYELNDKQCFHIYRDIQTFSQRVWGWYSFSSSSRRSLNLHSISVNSFSVVRRPLAFGLIQLSKDPRWMDLTKSGIKYSSINFLKVQKNNTTFSAGHNV